MTYNDLDNSLEIDPEDNVSSDDGCHSNVSEAGSDCSVSSLLSTMLKLRDLIISMEEKKIFPFNAEPLLNLLNQIRLFAFQHKLL